MNENAIWRLPNKTVYILGAGFSKPAGIPTIGEFIPQAFEVLKNEKNTDNLNKFCKLVEKYQIGAARLGLKLENIENLFCLIDLPSAYWGTQNKDNDKDGNVLINEEERNLLINVIIKTVLEKCKCSSPYDNNGKNYKQCDKVCCIPRRHFFPTHSNIRSVSREGYGTCIYEAFLSYVFKNQEGCKKIKELNTVITFNYDLVIERAIQAFWKASNKVCIWYGKEIIQNINNNNKSYVLNDAPNNNLCKTTLHYLKLHGSLNWSSTNGYPEKVNIRDSIGTNPKVPLVPPTWKKGSQGNDIFTKMINQAIEHLQLASKIVIIGYSIPEYDIYFKYMLALALNTAEFPKIEVWDVKDKSEIQPRLKHIFGPENVKRVPYFKGGLKAFVTSHISGESDK